MRLGLNLLALRPKQGAGVERFARNVVGSMRFGHDHKLWVGIRADARLANLLGEHFMSANTVGAVSRWHSLGTISRLLIEMILLCAKTYSLDAVLSINNFGPLVGKPGQRRVVVIHDVWFLESVFDGSWLKRCLFGVLIRIQLLSTTHIVTVSEFSKEAIIRHLKVDEKKITVVYNCMPPSLIAIDGSAKKNRVDAVTDPVFPGDYFLMVGSDRPNKNIWRGVHGYLEFARKAINPPSVCVVGHYSDAYKDRLKSVISADLAPLVVIRGFVSDEEYRQLIEGCIGVVFPSLYEGFGIPVVEAMESGKRILVAKETVCEEIAGEFGVSIDAKDELQISSGLATLLDNRNVDLPQKSSRGLGQYQDCPSAAKDLLTAFLATS